MRIIIEGWGRRLVDLKLLPARREAAPQAALVLHPFDRDPHSTLSSQVEQAHEPPAGFGVGQVVSMDEQRRKHEPGPEA